MFGLGRYGDVYLGSLLLVVACGGDNDPAPVLPGGGTGGHAGGPSLTTGGTEAGGAAGEASSARGGVSAHAGDAGQSSGGAELANGGSGAEPDTSAGGEPIATGGATSGGAATGGASSGGASTGGIASEAGAGAANGGEAEAGAGGGAAVITPVLPGATAFDVEQILEFRMTISESDWQELEEHGDLEQYLPAAAAVSGSHLEGVTFANVGLRHKGSYSLHHCWDEFDGVRSHDGLCEKLSYKIKFDEFDSKARFDGLKRINLHASSGDPTKLRELLAYDTFRAFGVDAPRARPAKLYINDQYQGVFIAVEEPDGRYAKAHFPDGPDGNLYKEMWPRAEQTDEALMAALETNEDAADVSDMKGFASTIAAASESSFLADMAPWIDVDTVLRYIAVDRALKNWDGITAFYAPTFPHNYYFYHDSSASPRFHLIPWDLDNTFQAFDPFMHPQDWVTAPPIPDWNSHPANCEPRPVWTFDSTIKVTPPRCDPFLDLLARTSWPRFAELGEELLAGPLKFTVMNAKVAQWLSELEPLVADDPTLDPLGWIESASTFPQELGGTIQDFKRFLTEGLIEEAPQGPSLEALNAPTEDDGLHVGGITNFEFTNVPIGAPAALWSASDPLSTIDALTWNTTNPLSGSADLRFDFTFQRSPATYDEWVNLGLGTTGGGEADLRGYTSVVFQVVTDRPRRLRVRIASPAYDDAYGGIWQEFGVELGVTANPGTVRLRLADFTYPAWAKAAWTNAQGFGSNDEAAWALVMSRCNGLIFVPQPSLDANGELIDDSEPGYLQLDNIYFR